jgi:hypothetical protein
MIGRLSVKKANSKKKGAPNAGKFTGMEEDCELSLLLGDKKENESNYFRKR